MPEAAEVKLNADFLNEAFNDEPIINLTINSGRFLKEKPFYWDYVSWDLFDLNQPFYITNVKSRGKFLYGQIEGSGLENIINEKIYFTSKLGMTGFWTDQNLKHNHLTFELISGKKISFNDARTFGNFKFIMPTSLINQLILLGVDSLNTTNQEWKNEIFSPKITTRLQKIKNKTQVGEVLLDQSIFCGVGNYLKSEILFACNIHPQTKWNDLSEFQIWNLFVQTRLLIKKAYEANGASFKSFKDSSGKMVGKFQEQFWVYGRTLTPDGEKVLKGKFQDKRTTFYTNNQTIF